jgi:tRNA-specific 2-thiouridylase
LKDLRAHSSELRVHELHLLRYGRHMRLGPQTKIVVGRTKQDNEQLLRHCDPQSDTVIKVKKYPGPTVVMPGGGAPAMILLAAAICAGYSKAPQSLPVAVQVVAASRLEEVVVLSIPPAESKRFLII